VAYNSHSNDFPDKNWIHLFLC